MGRPSSFSQDIADEICARISDGESLLSICRADHMPHRQTVMRWLITGKDEQFDAFRSNYARAREAQAEAFVDEIADIADGSTPEDWTVARLRVDARKWAAGKLAPKKYGDRLDQYIKQETTVRTVSDTPEDTAKAMDSWVAQHGNGHANGKANGKTNGNGHG